MTNVNIQKLILILNVHLLSKRRGKYVKQKLIELERETDKSVIKIGNHNTYLSITNRTARQKIGKNMEGLSYITNQ